MPRQQAYSSIDGSTPSRRRKALLAITCSSRPVHQSNAPPRHRRDDSLVDCAQVAALAFKLPDTLRGAVEDPKAAEDLEKDVLTGDTWVAPEAKKRCDWISDHYAEKDSKLSKDDLHTKYKAQGKDANSFYRATADLFWHDFVNGGWGEFDLLRLADPLKDGSPLQRTSTWTWVTGDQHLSNFGAFHARDGDVVYGMNDFDEAVGDRRPLRHRRDSCPSQMNAVFFEFGPIGVLPPRRRRRPRGDDFQVDVWTPPPRRSSTTSRSTCGGSPCRSTTTP